MQREPMQRPLPTSNIPPRFEEFAQVDLNDMEIPSMSSHMFNMSPDDIIQPGRGSDSRTKR